MMTPSILQTAHLGGYTVTLCSAVGGNPEVTSTFYKKKSFAQILGTNSKSSIESEQAEMEPLSPKPQA